MVRNRGWLLACAAVLLPVAALCWMQWRSMDELESKTRTAVRESLRHNLELVRHDLESRVDTMAREALGAIGGDDFGSAAAKLNAVRVRWPEIDQAFLVSQCGCRGAPIAVISSSGRSQALKCSHLNDPGIRAVVDAFRAARPSGGFEYFQYQHRSAGSATASCGSCHQTDWLEQRESAVYVFRVLPGPGGRESASFAGLRIRTGHLSEQLLPLALAAVKQQVGESSWNVRVASAPAVTADQVAVNGGAILPLWSLIGEYEGNTIHSLARGQLRRTGALWMALLACLLLGVAVTVRAAAREAQLAEMKSAFVSNISHEMKTPLATIRAFAETLELGRVNDPARMRSYFHEIHKESVRLSDLIDNVLDLARMQAGGNSYQFELTDPGRLVDEVCDGYRHQILSGGFQMSVRIDRPLPPVRADVRALSAAVLNLLSNAVKYSRDSRRIDVRVWQDNQKVQIAVTDQGIGIPEADQQRVFEKFYRGGHPLVHDVKGAGLGLALAREIARAHGGGIQVESRPGCGSTFTIQLPSAAFLSPEAAPLAENTHR